MIRRLTITWGLTLAMVTASAADETIISLDGKTLPGEAGMHHVNVEPTVQDGKPALKVHFRKVDWPNIFFRPEQGVWDWSAHAGLSVDVFNPENEPVPFRVRVDNAGADGWNNCNTGQSTAKPGQWTTLSMNFHAGERGRFWGMRGIPGVGRPASGTVIDLSKITAFQVFLPQPDREHTLLITNIRLTGSAADSVALPFVDKFGQYKHAGWPGKLRSERELTRRAADEMRLLESAEFPGLSRYGGWAQGPRLDATGWFRTEKVNGKWWLVDPDGYLFFSAGVDCVRTGDSTFSEKREDWFEWLPGEEDEFKPAVGYVSGVHSMADAIGGRGKTINFFRVNVIRKYGGSWQQKFREVSLKRLKAWGFNTVGNWSQEDVMTSGLPFVATAGVWGDFRRIEGGGGYWGKMPDVFDPGYSEAAAKSIEPTARKFAANRFCIGYFVDNEIAWDAIERGTLASPPDQPCRIEMVRILEDKYGGIGALNVAWETDASGWDDLRVPGSPNGACRKDLDDWVYTFSRKYFDSIKGVLRRHAPNQLYLGCRFAWRHPQAVRAAADVADVVSFNIYAREVSSRDWIGQNDLGKPLIIGEFHFGALDRGMFHQGLVPTEDQKHRADSFARYVRSVVDCPAFIGCHWFQYTDQPNTGRTLDGENYNIGLVDITDTPYPEMVRAAKQVHGEMYQRRYGAK